jgi:catechol 2,3-dioxygenase-like lactoylglutathione lyase family enzyme
MGINGLDHINIDTCLPEETIAFYTDVLGLEDRVGARPNFDFPGAWLWVGDVAVVHLNFIDADDRFGNRNAFNHVAFAGSDFDAMCAVLDERGLDYKTATVDGIGVRQIFVNDPNGIRVEINISSS